ncbi:MAG: hypothetical protein NC089_06805 [Bacteroides sp.]|nr:hypothetical protein [Bacteroides sp.]MCM1548442.1 hypothetical protein [Clostridium sp.]
MKKWKWLEWFRKRKQKNLNQSFAEKVEEKYQWKREAQYSFAFLYHRRNRPPNTIIQQVNLQQVEQLIQKYMPRTVVPVAAMVQRQERTRLLTILEHVSSQDGERKQLEQLIFRRKEQEWKKTLQIQEETVHSLRQEILQQRKVIETLEKRVSEPGLDVGRLYGEFRKRMEQQLRLERQRAGL